MNVIGIIFSENTSLPGRSLMSTQAMNSTCQAAEADTEVEVVLHFDKYYLHCQKCNIFCGHVQVSLQ